MKRFNVAFASLLWLAAPCAADRLAKDLHAGSSDHKRHPGGAGMIQLAGVPDGATVDLEFTTELDRAPWQDVAECTALSTVPGYCLFNLGEALVRVTVNSPGAVTSIDAWISAAHGAFALSPSWKNDSTLALAFSPQDPNQVVLSLRNDVNGSSVRIDADASQVSPALAVVENGGGTPFQVLRGAVYLENNPSYDIFPGRSALCFDEADPDCLYYTTAPDGGFVFGRGNQVFILINGDGAHFGSPIGPQLLRAPTHESIRPLRDVNIGIGGTATEGRLYHSLGVTLAWTDSAVKIDDQLHFVHEYSTAPSLGPNDRAMVASQADNAPCWWNGTGWVNMLTSAACTF